MTELQTNIEFLPDLVSHIQKAGKRVWIQNFYFQFGPQTEKLVASLVLAAQRGVDTRVQIDAWSLYVAHGGTVLQIMHRRKHFRAHRHVIKSTRTMITFMKAHGVKVSIVNPFLLYNHIIPELGRNHDKTFIVDEIAWKGGVNINPRDFEKADIMAKFTHQPLVDVIAKSYFQVGKNRPRNYAEDVPPFYTFLYDRGDRRQSLIYTHTLELMNSDLSKLTFMSQVPPRAQILSALISQAKKGRYIRIFLPHEESNFLRNPIHRPFYKRFVRVLRKYPHISLFQLPIDAHVKALQVEQSDGQKISIIGSHNFARIGVLAGTQESSVEIREPHFNQQLEKYFVVTQATCQNLMV